MFSSYAVYARYTVAARCLHTVATHARSLPRSAYTVAVTAVAFAAHYVLYRSTRFRLRLHTVLRSVVVTPHTRLHVARCTPHVLYAGLHIPVAGYRLVGYVAFAFCVTRLLPVAAYCPVTTFTAVTCHTRLRPVAFTTGSAGCHSSRTPRLLRSLHTFVTGSGWLLITCRCACGCVFVTGCRIRLRGYIRYIYRFTFYAGLRSQLIPVGLRYLTFRSCGYHRLPYTVACTFRFYRSYFCSVAVLVLPRFTARRGCALRYCLVTLHVTFVTRFTRGLLVCSSHTRTHRPFSWIAVTHHRQFWILCCYTTATVGWITVTALHYARLRCLRSPRYRGSVCSLRVLH